MESLITKKIVVNGNGDPYLRQLTKRLFTIRFAGPFLYLHSHKRPADTQIRFTISGTMIEGPDHTYKTRSLLQS